MSSEAEKAFTQEVREKKRAANGAHSMRGKRGLVGSVKTPADLLTGKARREYEASSEVITSSIFDKLIPAEKFNELTKRERMLYLHSWAKRYTVKQIGEQLGKSAAQVYNILKSHGVATPRQQKQRRSPGSKKAAPVAAETLPEQIPSTDPEPTETKAPADAPEPSTNTCDYRMSGTYSGTDLAAKLQGLSAMCLPDGRYEVSITWREL